MPDSTSRRLPRPARIAFRAVCILVPAITLTLMFEANILASYRYLRGEHGICSLAQSWKSAIETSRQVTRAAELHKASSKSERPDESMDVWRTPDGTWWVPSGSGDAILYDLAEQDRDIYRVTSGGIKPGDVVLDCGANIGVFTRKALEQGASKVIAIEPAPENLAALRHNLAKEIEEGKVVVYAKGVWNQDDVLKLYRDPHNSAGDSFVRRSEASSEIEVALTTVDHLVEELRLDRVDFIKMDIEGAERQAIAGAAATIRRFHPRMALCTYHLKDDQVVVPKAVLAIDPAYDYECGCMNSKESVFAEVAHFRPKPGQPRL